MHNDCTFSYIRYYMKMTADFLLSRLIHNTGTLWKYAKVTFFCEMYSKGVLSKWYTKGGAGFWGRAPPYKSWQSTPLPLTPRETHAFFGREIGRFHFHLGPPRTKLYRKPNSQVSEVNPGLLWHGDWPAPIPCDESLSSWAASQLRTLRNVQQLVLKTGCQQTPRK